jgi:hypothetical protein
MADSNNNENAGQVAPNTIERAKRDSLFLLAEVIRETGEPMGNAKVRNLSATGLMADCDFAFLQGDRLVIDLRGIGPVVGEVVWSNGMRMGFHFDREVDPQRARKPVSSGEASKVPLYLRYLNHSTQFKR